MGGNAIIQKGFNSVRVDKNIYTEIKQEIEQILKDEIFVISPEFSDKESFGDVDVIVQHNGSEHITNIYNKFIDTGKIDGFSKNKTIYSLAYRLDKDEYFQIDLIFVTEQNLEGTSIYTSFGDMFNLLGRISKRIGAKLSHKGFEYIVRANDKVVGEVILTRDFRKIFEILGLDYDYFKKGLGNGTQKEMFDFIISSKYFSMDSFDSEHFTARNTKRQKNRPGFSAFLDYIKTKEKLKFHISIATDKDDILEFFPEKLDEVQKLKDLAELREEGSRKFNGKMVQEVLGLEGKKLGEFIIDFKKIYTLQEIVDLENIEETIKNVKKNQFLKDFNNLKIF